MFLLTFHSLLVFGLTMALVALILWRTLSRSDDPTGLVTRWLLSLGVAGVAGWLVTRAFHYGGLAAAEGGMVAGFATAMVVAGLAAGVGIFLGALWAPHVANFVAGLLTNSLDGGAADEEPPPLYAIARARRKQGRREEALAEVRAQLSRHPQDCEGLLLLAEMQAEDCGDLEAAEDAVETLLAVPDLLPGSAALALNRLADWKLKRGRDEAGAREALERVVRDYPGTEQSHYARQRLAHLEGAAQQLEAQAQRAPIHLERHEEYVGLREDFQGLKAPETDPTQTATQLVQHLARYPDDCEARERLARCYLEEFHRSDLAVGEIEQLLADAGQPARQRAHWYHLLADVHVKGTGDERGARRALESIIEQYPKQAAAENARQRLARLGLELRARREGTVVRFGARA